MTQVRSSKPGKHKTKKAIKAKVSPQLEYLDETYLFDSSEDESAPALRIQTKKDVKINQEQVQTGKYLESVLGIFNHLHCNEGLSHFKVELQQAIAVSAHDFSSRFLRISKVNEEYRKKKHDLFSFSSGEIEDLVQKLGAIFNPLAKKYFDHDILNNGELKALFNIVFDYRCALPETLSITRGSKIGDLKKDLLGALQDNNDIQEAFWEHSIKESLDLKVPKSAADGSAILSCSLVESRGAKNAMKGIKILERESYSIPTKIQIEKLGLGQSLTHTATLHSESLNSAIQIQDISTYKAFLESIPEEQEKVDCLVECVLGIILNKIEFPLKKHRDQLKSSKDLLDEDLVQIQNCAQKLVHLFLVETTRNPACMLTFPMWLELLKLHPEQYKTAFPMEMVGAVSNSRGLHDTYSDFIFNPHFLDFDKTNRDKDGAELLLLESSLFLNWSKVVAKIGVDSLLKSAEAVFHLQFIQEIEEERLSVKDLTRAQGALKYLSYKDLLFTDTEARFLQHLEDQTLPCKTLMKSKKINKKSKESLKKIFDKHFKNLAHIKEIVKKESMSLAEQEKNLIKEFFIHLEKKIPEWYNIEVPQNLKMTIDTEEQQVGKILYDPFSPQKKKTKKASIDFGDTPRKLVFEALVVEIEGKSDQLMSPTGDNGITNDAHYLG